MAEFVEVMKNRRRLCETYNMCAECPMDKKNNKKNISCEYLFNSHHKEAEEIIMKWAEEHPIKTNADKLKVIFKEVFGVELDIEALCGCIGIRTHCTHNCEYCKYHNFWEQEYKEPKAE